MPGRESRPDTRASARRLATRVGLAETSRLHAQLLELARARRVQQARRLAGRQWEALQDLSRRASVSSSRARPSSSSGRSLSGCARSAGGPGRRGAGARARARDDGAAGGRAGVARTQSGARRCKRYAWAFIGNAHRTLNFTTLAAQLSRGEVGDGKVSCR